MKKNKHRILSLLLAALLVVGLVPALAFADGEAQTSLSIYNEQNMFKVVNAFIETSGGQTYLKFALNGTGYENIYPGTYDRDQ